MIFRDLTYNFGRSGRAGKNGFDTRNQQEKSYQNDELFFLGFGKVLKNAGQCNLTLFYVYTEWFKKNMRFLRLKRYMRRFYSSQRDFFLKLTCFIITIVNSFNGTDWCYMVWDVTSLLCLSWCDCATKQNYYQSVPLNEFAIVILKQVSFRTK